MPKIRFTQNHVLHDEHRGTDRETKFGIGDIREFRDSTCEFWKNLGLAEDYVPPVKKLAERAAPAPAYPSPEVQVTAASVSATVIPATAKIEKAVGK